MNTDPKVGGCDCAQIHRHPLVARINGCLSCLAGLADPKAKRSVRWTPLAAALAAVLMALDPGCTLHVRCEDALGCMAGDFKRRRRVGTTYNGLLKALERQSGAVLPLLKADLRERVWRAIGMVPKVAGWTLLAVDGSKDDLPRTTDNEKVFGFGDNGVWPQAFVTAIVEVQAGLPWDWRVDKARASEKDHLMEMAQDLPDDALLLADGNFVGHGVWSALIDHGKSFLIRVGGNVSLIRDLFPGARIERQGDIVYAWPVHHQSTLAPLRLRLLRVGSKKNPVYLLTNVLDPARLSKRAAGTIYRLRWGVELFYRTLKRTLGYAKLRSRSGRRGKLELEWGLITATILALIGTHALRRRRVDPRRQSPAAVVRVLRGALLRGAGTKTAGALAALDRALARAVKDNYRRRGGKAARHNPITKITPYPLRLKPPRVRRATDAERRRAIAHHENLTA